MANGIQSRKSTITVNNFDITSISPKKVLVGSTGVAVTINGWGFVPGSVASFGNTQEPTTYVSESQLIVSLPNTYEQATSTVSVLVTNPDTTTTNSEPFVVYNPTAVLSSMNPASCPTGASVAVVTVTGTGFLSSSRAYISGTKIRTVYLSPTQLRIEIPASSLTTNTTLPIDIQNPSPGGGPSNVLDFTVGSGSGGSGGNLE